MGYYWENCSEYHCYWHWISFVAVIGGSKYLTYKSSARAKNCWNLSSIFYSIQSGYELYENRIGEISEDMLGKRKINKNGDQSAWGTCKIPLITVKPSRIIINRKRRDSQGVMIFTAFSWKIKETCTSESSSNFSKSQFVAAICIPFELALQPYPQHDPEASDGTESVHQSTCHNLP